MPVLGWCSVCGPIWGAMLQTQQQRLPSPVVVAGSRWGASSGDVEAPSLTQEAAGGVPKQGIQLSSRIGMDAS